MLGKSQYGPIAGLRSSFPSMSKLFKMAQTQRGKRSSDASQNVGMTSKRGALRRVLIRRKRRLLRYGPLLPLRPGVRVLGAAGVGRRRARGARQLRDGVHGRRAAVPVRRDKRKWVFACGGRASSTGSPGTDVGDSASRPSEPLAEPPVRVASRVACRS